ncbi:Protein CBG24035 [Caenorhabditis briggsae]|uniref:Protein CBG24035 n=1 Tax=Caenorhabditis briggsae TaxID=6238 RepID=A8WJU7_CAEBR|nr:Protein CBG24035 [Caenorhabditis briggsae]CAP20740.1 Protein CBG24035 [Caenorhabditis briggsae]
MVNRSVRRSRKDAASTERSSSGANLKRRSRSNSLGSESEDNAQEERPIRRAARRVNYDETVYDFEESPIRKKAEKRRMNKPKQRVDSKKDASSSSESESESEPDERKSKGVRRAQGKRTQRFTDEQIEILLAVFRETEFPSKAQKEKLAEETNRTICQIERWFDNRKQSIRNPRPVKRYVKKFTVEQKRKMDEVFVASRNPEKGKIAALVAELELTTTQVRQYFRKQRFKNPIPEEIPRFLSEEQVEHGIVDGETFKRERNSEKRNQFEDAMEKFFEERQFLEEPDETLELESGGSRKRISDWLDKKRYDTLKSFLEKEISVLPNEMATFEKLSEKYCLDTTTHPDVILYIEMKEDVNGDSIRVGQQSTLQDDRRPTNSKHILRERPIKSAPTVPHSFQKKLTTPRRPLYNFQLIRNPTMIVQMKLLLTLHEKRLRTNQKVVFEISSFRQFYCSRNVPIQSKFEGEEHERRASRIPGRFQRKTQVPY